VRIAFTGGLDHMYAAMAAHVGVSEVQWQACRALANLSINDDNKVRIVSTGGLDHMYAAMAAHVRVSEVQWQGVRCLYNLSLSSTNLPALSAGGQYSSTIRAALAAHPAHADIQRLAPKALTNLNGRCVIA
jgi:hypothetical protein